MGILADKIGEAKALNGHLERAQRLLRLPGGSGASRGASSNDIRRLRGDIQRLGQQVSGMGGGSGTDPFLSDLARGSGPRRV